MKGPIRNSGKFQVSEFSAPLYAYLVLTDTRLIVNNWYEITTILVTLGNSVN